jgi:multisubunit Na+/H+ antiporter MnhG subunit
VTFTQEYLLLVFFLCSGVIQVASAYGGLNGLLFFKSRTLCAVLGIGLIAGSLVWFFYEGGRNIPDTNGGIAGASQFGLFALGGFLALLFTVLTTSLTNHRIGAGYDHENVTDTADGLPSLRETTFVQALMNNLSALWKLYRRLTQRYSSG